LTRRVDTLDMEGVIGLIAAGPPSIQESELTSSSHNAA
jgi:hypothetical protein